MNKIYLPKGPVEQTEGIRFQLDRETSNKTFNMDRLHKGLPPKHNRMFVPPQFTFFAGQSPRQRDDRTGPVNIDSEGNPPNWGRSANVSSHGEGWRWSDFITGYLLTSLPLPSLTFFFYSPLSSCLFAWVLVYWWWRLTINHPLGILSLTQAQAPGTVLLFEFLPAIDVSKQRVEREKCARLCVGKTTHTF